MDTRTAEENLERVRVYRRRRRQLINHEDPEVRKQALERLQRERAASRLRQQRRRQRLTPEQRQAEKERERERQRQRNARRLLERQHQKAEAEKLQPALPEQHQNPAGAAPPPPPPPLAQGPMLPDQAPTTIPPLESLLPDDLAEPPMPVAGDQAQDTPGASPSVIFIGPTAKIPVKIPASLRGGGPPSAELREFLSTRSRSTLSLMTPEQRQAHVRMQVRLRQRRRRERMTQAERDLERARAREFQRRKRSAAVAAAAAAANVGASNGVGAVAAAAAAAAAAAPVMAPPPPIPSSVAPPPAAGPRPATALPSQPHLIHVPPTLPHPMIPMPIPTIASLHNQTLHSSDQPFQLPPFQDHLHSATVDPPEHHDLHSGDVAAMAHHQLPHT